MHPLSLNVMTWSLGLFRWLTPGSVLLGVGETFVFGAYAGFVFTLIHNTVLRRSR